MPDGVGSHSLATARQPQLSFYIFAPRMPRRFGCVNSPKIAYFNLLMSYNYGGVTISR